MIAGVAGDQQAALFGQLCWAAGEAKNTYGTGCFLLQNIGTEFARSKAQADYHAGSQRRASPRVCLRGSIFIGGAPVVQWLRDNLKLIGSSAEVEQLAGQRAGLGRGGVCRRRSSGWSAPHWDPHARGMLIRIAPGHLARPDCALRSKASPFRWPTCSRPVQSETTPLAALRVDGGAAVNNLLKQYQADVLG